MATEFKLNYTGSEINQRLAAVDDIPTKTSDLFNDSGFLSEIPPIPTKVSDLTNDIGYLTEETDPTVPTWAKASSKPTYTYNEVGADKEGTASTAVSAHNTSTDSHNDIRLLITELSEKLTNFLDVDVDTTNQLSDLLALINDNATDIQSITNGKVNVSDIINNLTTNVSNKPLSAAQGVALKGLIDDAAYTHPTTSGNKHIPSGGSSGQILRWSANGTAVWGADNNTTYSDATTSAAGLMSASDKSKLDSITVGAVKIGNITYTLRTGTSGAANTITFAI